jgi:hypothetical protein
MSFSTDVRKICDKQRKRLDIVAKTIKLKLFSGVIHDTRVGNTDGWKDRKAAEYALKNGYVGGRLKGNWQTSTGAPKFGVIDRIDKDGNEAIAEAVANVTAFGVDYLTNNLPYAEVWEENDGMIAKNLARLDRTIKKAVASA